MTVSFNSENSKLTEKSEGYRSSNYVNFNQIYTELHGGRPPSGGGVDGARGLKVVWELLLVLQLKADTHRRPAGLPSPCRDFRGSGGRLPGSQPLHGSQIGRMRVEAAGSSTGWGHGDSGPPRSAAGSDQRREWPVMAGGRCCCSTGCRRR